MNKLFLSMILMALPLLVSAYDVEVDGIYYNLKSGNRAEVTYQFYYSGYSPSYYSPYNTTEVTIPEKFTFEGVEYSVTAIGNYAFSGCSDLTSVTIPISVKSIGIRAFLECRALTSVNIPNSVTSIRGGAFEYCYGLTSIIIPNSVTDIADSAFRFCAGLSSIIVEKGNSVYDSREECNAIIKTNTNTLVMGCKNTVIPNSVTSIGECAFEFCYGLTSIIIPNSVTDIGGFAFDTCVNMTSLTIGKSVVSIGEDAFQDCRNLKEVYCLADKVPITGTNVFQNSNFKSAILYVPDKSLNDYKTTAPWSEFGLILPISSETKIEKTTMQEAEEKDRYSLDGIKRGFSKKGLNIIRMNDGTVKKVVVK